MIETYLFDLDGTLTDSRAGLLQSFRAGFAALGAPELTEEHLHGFLGTPLPAMFRSVLPTLDDAGVATGIAAFRRAYEAAGIRANVLYPGVRAMLERLREQGCQSWVVTSKPEPYATAVVQALGLQDGIDGVIGAALAETDTKTELVARALSASGSAPRNCLMVGDRSYDVIGAIDNGVWPVGALWGYGTRAELKSAGCTRFAASIREFEARFVLTTLPAAAAVAV